MLTPHIIFMRTKICKMPITNRSSFMTQKQIMMRWITWVSVIMVFHTNRFYRHIAQQYHIFWKDSQLEKIPSLVAGWVAWPVSLLTSRFASILSVLTLTAICFLSSSVAGSGILGGCSGTSLLPSVRSTHSGSCSVTSSVFSSSLSSSSALLSKSSMTGVGETSLPAALNFSFLAEVLVDFTRDIL